jgi:hypothetical protein
MLIQFKLPIFQLQSCLFLEHDLMRPTIEPIHHFRAWNMLQYHNILSYISCQTHDITCCVISGYCNGHRPPSCHIFWNEDLALEYCWVISPKNTTLTCCSVELMMFHLPLFSTVEHSHGKLLGTYPLLTATHLWVDNGSVCMVSNMNNILRKQMKFWVITNTLISQESLWFFELSGINKTCSYWSWIPKIWL